MARLHSFLVAKNNGRLILKPDIGRKSRPANWLDMGCAVVRNYAYPRIGIVSEYSVWPLFSQVCIPFRILRLAI